MKILFVSQYFWPEEFLINELVSELIDRGHEVTVLTGLPNYPDGKIFHDFLLNQSSFSRYKGSVIYRVPMLPRGNSKLSLFLNYISFALSALSIGVWKLRSQKYDTIIAFQLSPVTVGLPAIMIRFIKKIPLLFWIQDLWPDTLQALDVIRSKLILSAIGKLVSFIYRRCDLILVQSKKFIPHVRKYLLAEQNVVYFPNWSRSVNSLKLQKPASEISSMPGYFTIMFAGNIGEAQDFPAILAAAERLKGHTIRWLIVGEGRMENWVATEIIKRDLQKCVTMLGKFPPHRMGSLFRHADALLVSLKDEPIFSLTIPSKLQTYLSTGLPVLAMLNGAGAELILESSSGLACKAGDHEGLAKAVLQLIKMTPEARHAMGQKGLLLSNSEFDRNKLIDRLECLIAQVKYNSTSSIS